MLGGEGMGPELALLHMKGMLAASLQSLGIS